jgi:Winged helix DNA-binding domain
VTGLSPDEWASRRWSACGLGGGRWAEDAASAIGRFAAMQAQEFDASLWSLSQRTGQTRNQILAEFQAGRFVRTHAVRQTWHFVRREDLARVQAATADRVHQASAGMYRSIGLDPDALDSWARWLRRRLALGPMTRVQLRAALEADGRPMENFTMMIALMWAELELIIANGPLQDKAQTYRLLEDEPLPDRTESITWLVNTFLASHGPSSVADVAAWSSLKRSDIRGALDRIGAESAQGPEGTCYWADGPPVGQTPGTKLLNGYDEYVGGLSAASKRALDRDGLALERRGAPIHCIMSNGYLAGYWRRKEQRSGTSLLLIPRRRLGADERTGLAEQAAAFAAFTGSDVEVQEEPQWVLRS